MRCPAMLGLLLLLGSAGAQGCGDDGPPATPPELRSDARALSEVMVEDATLGALAEVDVAVEDGRPTRASELLATGAIPAARRQLERLSTLDIHTSEGVALRRQATEAYRARLEALEQYHQALRRGEVEDLQLVEALRAQRQAEDAVAAALEAAESHL